MKHITNPMKKKYIYLFLILLFSFIFITTSGKVNAVECGSALVSQVSCDISQNTILNNGRYWLNGTSGTSGIRFTASNIVLEGSNSIIEGNGMDIGAFAITSQFGSNVNITIRNIRLNNFTEGIRINGADDWKLVNVTITNTTIGMNLLNKADNTTIVNNTIISATIKGLQLNANGTWIQNNLFYNSNQSIYINNQFTNNTYILGNNITQFTNTTAITLTGGWNIYIYNNSMIGSSTFLSGIDSTGSTGYNVTIYNNYIYGYYHGAYLSGFSFVNMTNNVVNWTSGGWGLSTFSDNTSIIGNWLWNIGWNAIKFQSYGNYIGYNNINCYGHHGIDANNDANTTVSGNTIIEYNNITCNNYGYSSVNTSDNGDASIFLTSTKNVTVRYNYIFNNFDNDTQAGGTRGIAVEHGDWTRNISVYNNRFENISGVCIYDDSLMTIYSNNICSGLQNTTYSFSSFGSWMGSYNITYTQYYNNTDLSKIPVYYFQQNNRSSISIYQGGSQFVIINTNKDYNSVTIYNLTRARVFYGNGTVVTTDITGVTGSITLGLNAGVNVTVIDKYNSGPNAIATSTGMCTTGTNPMIDPNTYSIIFVIMGIILVFFVLRGMGFMGNEFGSADDEMNWPMIIGVTVALVIIAIIIMVNVALTSNICGGIT